MVESHHSRIIWHPRRTQRRVLAAIWDLRGRRTLCNSSCICHRKCYCRQLRACAEQMTALNPIRILKNSSRITVINSVGSGLNFFALAWVARFLGLELFGEISFVLLWVGYAALVRPGFFEGGQRELIGRLGQGDNPGA